MNSEFLWQFCGVLVLLGVSCVDADEVSVSVLEGNSVTLHTGVTANQHGTIKWYFYGIRVGEINKGHLKICRDDECKKRFGNRLELDHQNGSLTITNTTITDSGLYHLDIINSGSDSEKTFNVTVNGVSAPSNHQMKINPAKEGGSDSGVSTAVVAGVGVVLLFVAAVIGCVIYYRKHHQAGQCGTGPRTPHSNQANGVTYSSVKHADNESAPVPNGHESADTNETSV